MQLPGSLCPTPMGWGLCLLQNLTLASNPPQFSVDVVRTVSSLCRVQFTTSLTTPTLLPLHLRPPSLCLLLLQ